MGRERRTEDATAGNRYVFSAPMSAGISPGEPHETAERVHGFFFPIPLTIEGIPDCWQTECAAGSTCHLGVGCFSTSVALVSNRLTIFDRRQVSLQSVAILGLLALTFGGDELWFGASAVHPGSCFYVLVVLILGPI